MLVAASGEYAGSISGGCLEGEVARKIAWLTRFGSTVEQYQSSIEDEEVPYGLGCGGTIWILMEAGSNTSAVLGALERAVEERLSSVAVSVTSGSRCGTVLARPTEAGGLTIEPDGATFLSPTQTDMAWRALLEKRLIATPVQGADLPQCVYNPIIPLPRLTVFGAGDDAKPLVRFAIELGWDVSVADGRSHLLRPERFPGATKLILLRYDLPKDDRPLNNESHLVLASHVVLETDEFAVILTHSLNQDRALLQALLPLSLSYLGILGPLHRTKRLLDDIAPAVGFSPAECLRRLHAPVGLDFGQGDASVIALSIVSEMQTILGKTSGAVERKRSSLSAIA